LIGALSVVVELGSAPVKRFLVVPVLALGLLAGCGSTGDSSDSTAASAPQPALKPKPKPEKVKLSAAQMHKTEHGIEEAFRSEAAAFGENSDYRVDCNQIGGTDTAKCHVTPFVEGTQLGGYIRTVTFDPAHPERCRGEGSIVCAEGAPSP
jgi:hypothetical protein